jgi:hypothetical protein
MNDAIKALTSNGLVKMDGVRGESYVYRSDGALTFFDLKGTQFYSQGEISHLPSILGYSEQEIRDTYCEMFENGWKDVDIFVAILMNRRKDGVAHD